MIFFPKRGTVTKLDEKIEGYIQENKPAWEAAAKKRFWKNVCVCLLALLIAFLALFTDYGWIYSLAICVAIFTKFVLEPWTIKQLKKQKGRNDEFG